MRDRYDEHQKKRNVNRIEIATRYIIDIIPIAIIERAIILERKILYDTMSKKIFINSVEVTTFRIEIYFRIIVYAIPTTSTERKQATYSRKYASRV